LDDERRLDRLTILRMDLHCRESIRDSIEADEVIR
jgi:hypothetical protein